MELLYNKTPKVELDHIHSLVIVGVSLNKADLVEVNERGAITFKY